MTDSPTVQQSKECQKCGQAHGQCKAHNRAGEPCGKRPRKGQRVCANHGGSSPIALAAADRRMALDDAVRTLGFYGEPVEDVDPSEAVMEVLRRTAGHTAWLAVQIGENGGLVDRDGVSVPGPYLELYERERDRVGRLAKIAHDMGIAQRVVQLEEQRGQLIAAGLLWLLGQLGLESDQRARDLTGKMLLGLSAGTVPSSVVDSQ